jgi:hypothetical protein
MLLASETTADDVILDKVLNTLLWSACKVELLGDLGGVT